MNENRYRMSSFVSAFLFIVFSVLAGSAHGAATSQRDAWGPRFQDGPRFDHGIRARPRFGLDAVRRWNDIALDANAADHELPMPNQLGPLRTARAFAIVHIAIFDAVNAIAGGYRGYTGLGRVRDVASIDAAVAQAAHDTLAVMFPSQITSFDMLLADDLSHIRDGRAKRNGIDLGRRAALAILALRASDDPEHSDQPYDQPGGYMPDLLGANKWRQDPISLIPIALGSLWDVKVKPFVLSSAAQFPIPEPPAASSPEFIAAFDEVKNYGGCGDDHPDPATAAAACALAYGGSLTSTMRTAEQTQIGIYWGYDGTPRLGTPPRMYNQIAVQIAEQKRTSGVELARLLAIINVAMAEGGLTAWKAKYEYNFARPITAIREAGFPTWTPLDAPASNKIGPNFTPPFPAYASGHATFGAALFQVLRKFYGTDRIAFTFLSDEYNGVTKDNNNVTRPLLPRSFSNLSQAEEENGQSRIFLGIHWSFDKTAGIDQGRRVADYVMKNAFTPLRRR